MFVGLICGGNDCVIFSLYIIRLLWVITGEEIWVVNRLLWICSVCLFNLKIRISVCFDFFVYEVFLIIWLYFFFGIKY